MTVLFLRRLHLVHQTSPQAAEKIISTQKLLPSTGGLYGQGCYGALTIEATDYKANGRDTYLIADFYIGKAISIDKEDAVNGNVNIEELKKKGFNSIIGYNLKSGKEYNVFDSERVRNIKYIYGIRPNADSNIKLKRAILFMVTDRITASQIVRKQQILKMQGPFGMLYYMYDSITDALSQNQGETFLAADANVKDCYEYEKGTFDINCLPEKWKSFKVQHNGITIYGFRKSTLVFNIHHVGGVSWI